jgi:hypothetical protein
MNLIKELIIYGLRKQEKGTESIIRYQVEL